jgi:hypothetical protein
MTTTAPLATVTDFLNFGSNEELIQNTTRWNASRLTSLMLRATNSIESRCQSLLAPFTGHVESNFAYGVGADEYGFQGDVPLDLYSALGVSQMNAFGVSDQVRRFWLDQVPPRNSEMWAYNVQSVTLLRTWGDIQTFGPEVFGQQLWQGPEVDTGEIRMAIGTLCPQGTTIRTVYDGGYNVSIPDDLNLACVLQAVKFVLIGAEPELRSGMSDANLDEELTMLLAPYTRICG